jgi:hypothetical protein
VSYLVIYIGRDPSPTHITLWRNGTCGPGVLKKGKRSCTVRLCAGNLGTASECSLNVSHEISDRPAELLVGASERDSEDIWFMSYGGTGTRNFSPLSLSRLPHSPSFSVPLRLQGVVPTTSYGTIIFQQHFKSGIFVFYPQLDQCRLHSGST